MRNVTLIKFNYFLSNSWKLDREKTEKDRDRQK